MTYETNTRSYVLAGNLSQFNYFIREVKRLEPGVTHYVSNEHVLRGQRGGALYLFGTWYTRKDVDEVIVMAKTRDMVIVEVEDNR